MNQEQAKKLLPIIQAFSEGKEVQYLTGPVHPANWSTVVSPTFTCDVQWRIKPEKKKVWINIYRDSREQFRCYAHETHETATAVRCGRADTPDLKACIQIEYEDGQGLSSGEGKAHV